MTIGYVCTNYNGSALSIAAAESLLAIRDCEIWITIVDNKSSADDLQELESYSLRSPNVAIIRSEVNLGYFGGLNLGIRSLRTAHPLLDCIVVGNNDLIFPANFVKKIESAQKIFEEYPVVSPDVVTLEGIHQNPHVIRPVGVSREIIYDLYYSNFFIARSVMYVANLFRPIADRKDAERWRESGEIHQGHGSCYILGPVFFRHFSELYAPTFLMGEEFFLSHQIALQGFRIFYEPGIQVEHMYHATIAHVPKRKMWGYAQIAHRKYREYVKPFRRRRYVARALRKGDGEDVRPYRVCTRCVMDTTDVKIHFDVEGVCDHCRTYVQHTLPSWENERASGRNLAKLVSDIKRSGEGKDFDCILGMSGGIDSSYLLYLAKEKLGLRPLVFHVDAGWNSQEAVNNIERLVDGLKLDLFTEVINWEEMRDLQLAYFKSGVPHIDAPQDLAFFGTMYKFAAKYNIKHILTGANLSTECIRNPVDWVYFGDTVQLRDIHKKFGTRPLASYPVSPILWHKVYLPFIKGIRVARPLNLMNYIKADAMKELVERFGWQPYPQKHFESRFTRFYEGFWLPKKFGYDTRKVQFSSLIMTNQMTRDQALNQLKKPAFDEATIARDFEYIATKLGISVSELQGYLDAPNKTYRDYKSQDWMFELGAWIMKKLGMEVGGKR
jgi:N-acetyl sugar amidotransferase